MNLKLANCLAVSSLILVAATLPVRAADQDQCEELANNVFEACIALGVEEEQ